MSKEKGLLEPFQAKQVQKGVISYGVGGYGYDIRLSNQFKRPVGQIELGDPKTFKEVETESFEADSVLIPPHSLIWGQSIEYFRLPNNVVTVAQGKSTYARLGLILNVTPFDPGWEGYPTLSLVNPMSYPIKVYANEGIAQILFFESDEACAVSYAQKGGKYHKAQGIETSKIKE